MQWVEIRRMQPDAWVLVEALQVHFEDKFWVFDDLALIRAFAGSAEAWSEYEALHKAKPDRDLWVLSTEWPEPKVEAFVWLGVRPAE
ncbi:MAG: hypothetical protein HY914_01935 [Desulfomonile tiedjei]|nr:hypothetical protein [Desulfomonile tiedjei]